MLGGTLLAVTGGLAAPAIIGGIGALSAVGGVGGAAAGGVAGIAATTGGTAALITLLGVGGGGLAGYKMAHRIGDVDVFKFERLSDSAAMRVCIWYAATRVRVCLRLTSPHICS